MSDDERFGYWWARYRSTDGRMHDSLHAASKAWDARQPEMDALKKELVHWKANHADEVRKKRVTMEHVRKLREALAKVASLAGNETQPPGYVIDVARRALNTMEDVYHAREL